MLADREYTTMRTMITSLTLSALLLAVSAVASASAANVQGAVIADSGHWLMEEQPQATVSVILEFLR
jgi:pimeloyl-ACP methyl ester carboxylesterase